MSRWALTFFYVLLLIAGALWITHRGPSTSAGGNRWNPFALSANVAAKTKLATGAGECVIDYSLKEQAGFGEFIRVADEVRVCSKDRCVPGVVVATLACPQTVTSICNVLLRFPKDGCDQPSKVRSPIASGAEKTWLEITKTNR